MLGPLFGADAKEMSTMCLLATRSQVFGIRLEVRIRRMFLTVISDRVENTRRVFESEYERDSSF